MKNKHCVPSCLEKFHNLGCIYLRKKVEKSQKNLVFRSKSDTEIIKLIKRTWKRKCLRHTENTTLISSGNGILPHSNYRYGIRNHNLFLYSNNIDKKEGMKDSKIDGDTRNEDIYRLLDATVRNHSISSSNSKTKLSFKKIVDNSSKCIDRKVKKNKEKVVKSTKKKNFKENDFGLSPAPLINAQTTLVGRIKSFTNFHEESLSLNDKKIKEKTSSISIISNRDDKVSNPINDNILSNKWLPMEDDNIASIVKNSLKTYMLDNAAFFENNIRSTCIYESVGELERAKSKDSVLQTHDENIYIRNDGSSKVYLESLLECAEIVNKNFSGTIKHKVINHVKHVKEHEIIISENFKNHLEKKKHHANNHIHKKREFNNFLGIRRNHMCSKKCFSSDNSNQNMKINKGYELSFKEISDELKGRKIIMKMEKAGILCRTRNNEMYVTYDINKNSTSTLIKKNINSTKNSLIINNFIKFNLIKQMKNMKLLKSFSDSCVDLGNTSKFCCIKSRKNNINYSFHNSNHGTRLMETSTNVLNNNDKISVKKVDFMKYDSTFYCTDNKNYCNHVNDRYQFKKIRKSYSNDSIKKPGLLKTFIKGKHLIEECGDFDVTKDNDCYKRNMSYVIYSCDGDKYTQKYEPKHVIDENQFCFADPELCYCDSELYFDNELPDSGQCSPELRVSSNYENLEHEGSTQSLKESKEKLNLHEEVFESHEGEVDTMVFQKQQCSLKLAKRKNNNSRNGIVKYENIEHWIHDIKKSESKESIKSDNGLHQNQKTNSELSILSDFGLNCNSHISNVSDLNGHGHHTATRDVAVSAVLSDEELKPGRSTIDKAIMCDEMTKNEQKPIMQLHRNNIIIESSEVIQLNGNGTSTYQSKDRELSSTITPTTEKFLKLELYQGESKTKYLEWRCNQVSNRSDHSIGTSHAEFSNISNDEFFGPRDKSHKSKELEELEFKNDFDYLCDEENHSAQSKNIWSSLKNGSQKVLSFFQPVGPLRTCFKKNIF